MDCNVSMKNKWIYVKPLQLKKEKIDSNQSFTEPPRRYTEASLVKALEERVERIKKYDA